MDAAVGDVDFNGVALVHQADGSALGGFGRGVPDAQTRCAARETPVGEQGAGFAQAFGFQVAGGVQHFLHPRPAFGTFVADDDNVARHDLVAQNACHGIFLAFKHAGTPSELPDAFVHAGGFHHAAALGDVAKQYRQAAVLRIGVRNIADAAVCAV